MAIGQSSGTYSFNLPLSDVLIDAYERCGIHDAALTHTQYQSGRRSLNLVNSVWANRGVNLWKVIETRTLMPQGVQTYAVDPSTVSLLDVYLRQFDMGSPVSVNPAFTTVSGQTAVTISGLSATPPAGSYIAIIIPVSVGGLILQGFYLVVSTPGTGQCTITAASPAASSVTGGTVPAFATTAGSQIVTVTLANHGLLAGQSFVVQVATLVGGINLSGTYTVGTPVTANTFTITAANIAGSTASATENGGQAQISEQTPLGGFSGMSPVDILLYPLSRDDWAAIPNKFQQGRPTSFWYDRVISPQINIWQVPDQNGPYELHYFSFQRIQDAVPEGGQTADLVFRFYEAYVAAVAAHLSVKWAPDRFAMLNDIATQAWVEASEEDREKVPLYLVPDFSSYMG